MKFYIKSGNGKFHKMYHRSRTWPWRGVAFCNYSGEISNECPTSKEQICKSCKRGPTEFVVNTFAGIRVAR